MAKDYRDHFHRPSAEESDPDLEGFYDRRDSLTPVYLSLIPFFFIEYVAESSRLLPKGLVLPVGFLLFWSFYYTYYKPGFLEQLGSPDTWNFAAIPAVLFGVCLWFLKCTVIEILHVLILRWIFTRPPAPTPVRPGASLPPPPDDEVHWRGERKAAKLLSDAQAEERRRALAVLGLQGEPSLDEIHHRYRELAKRFHPDLNPDVTDFGRRFIQIDQAYRKLALGTAAKNPR